MAKTRGTGTNAEQPTAAATAATSAKAVETDTKNTKANAPQVETKEVKQEGALPAQQESAQVVQGTQEMAQQVAAEVNDNPFLEALKIASESTTDKLHLENLIQTLNTLLAMEKEGCTKTQYEEAANMLLSFVRSLGVISDPVFIAAFPATLDTIATKLGNKKLVFVDDTAVFKIFTNARNVRGLSKDHAQFITAMISLARKQTRKSTVRKIDLATNFAVLPDAKRTRIKDIFR